MEFYIKKGATLPILKMKIIKDGRSDYNKFYNYVTGDTLYFSMFDPQTKIYRITSRLGKFIQSEIDQEYYATYQFKNRDTFKTGKYEGQFMLKTDEGNITFPLTTKIYINIVDSIFGEVMEDSGDNCYTSENPCCPVPSFTPTKTPTSSLTPTPTVTVTPSFTPTPTPTPV
jgi:hypothetical protein